MPFDFAALEASRLSRGGADLTRPVIGFKEDNKRRLRFVRQDYAVAKVFDDNEREPVTLKHNMTAADADMVAGKMRDAMSERDCELALAEGWNYRVITMRGSHPKGKRQAFVPGRRK